MTPRNPESPVVPHAIEVCGLSFRYPDNTTALTDVRFAVRAGDCVGLIGPNGAGKSTLLLHLNGLLPEKSQAESPVQIDGVPIGPHNLAQIRRAVGLLFQNPDDQIFCPTVWEDVAFGPRQFDPGQEALEVCVSTALQQVGLAGYENRAPHHLSHGEKRRVCLAGILACAPRILLLDEPTSDLDPRGRREFKALLRQIPATKLIASHDLELIAELCHRVIVLDRGVIVAEGPTTDLLRNESLMLAHGLECPHVLHHGHTHNHAAQ